MIYLPDSSKLNTRSLSRLFDNKSESYKLFWFKGILYYVKKNQRIITFKEIIYRMVLSAWYMVSEYKLNLGPRDTLERLVIHISDTTDITSTDKEEIILEYLINTRDKTVQEFLKVLSFNVPYRLQAPFFDVPESKMWNRRKIITSFINDQDGIIYRISDGKGLDKKIEIDDLWFEYLHDNLEVIEGWVNYNLIVYLQRRNPTVPGIPNKLEPPQQRNLTKVKSYWKELINQEDFRDIYSGESLKGQVLSIDHFIPWSYVASDELYNLIPTTRNVNSMKSNSLPEWNSYFVSLARSEYKAYMITQTNDKVKARFKKCADENLNNENARYILYREGLSENEFINSLEDILYPLYESAKNCGFREWTYQR